MESRPEHSHEITQSVPVPREEIRKKIEENDIRIRELYREIKALGDSYRRGYTVATTLPTIREKWKELEEIVKENLSLDRDYICPDFNSSQ
jgi:hypothetical protein